MEHSEIQARMKAAIEQYDVIQSPENALVYLLGWLEGLLAGGSEPTKEMLLAGVEHAMLAGEIFARDAAA